MKTYFYVLTLILFLSFISGCASSPKKSQIGELDLRVTDLEERTQKLEQGQIEIQDALAVQLKAPSEITSVVEPQELDETVKNIPETPSKEDIQVALKNAGFYNGEIDGKIGPDTRKAIMEFQEKNGLQVDGVVGEKTWEVLRSNYTQE